MKRLLVLAFSLFSLVAVPAFAADEKPTSAPAVAAPAARAASFPESFFNRTPEEKAAVDIDPATFKDFWKNWHFVTVRWRQDIREFRFTYANDLAWKVLSEKRTDYPVGAMFGKLVYPAEEDLALPSSVLASNLVSRFMVMRWDPKHKKAGSDGWVYVRVINPDPSFRLVERDKDATGVDGLMSEKEVRACVECHNRAYDRGNVFSQPLFLFREEKPGDAAVKDTKVLSIRYGDAMKEMGPKEIPGIARDLIGSMPDWKGRKVKGYQGDFIAGSLAELRPVLAKLVEQDPNTIYMIYDRDDPNTMAVASGIKKTGYDKCAGIVRLRGLRLEDDSQRPRGQVTRDSGGVGFEDMSQRFKPAVTLLTMCGGESVSRQDLPLLYKAQDKDGLPSYTFAPAAPE